MKYTFLISRGQRRQFLNFTFCTTARLSPRSLLQNLLTLTKQQFVRRHILTFDLCLCTHSKCDNINTKCKVIFIAHWPSELKHDYFWGCFQCLCLRIANLKSRIGLGAHSMSNHLIIWAIWICTDLSHPVFVIVSFPFFIFVQFQDLGRKILYGDVSLLSAWMSSLCISMFCFIHWHYVRNIVYLLLVS